MKSMHTLRKKRIEKGISKKEKREKSQENYQKKEER